MSEFVYFPKEDLTVILLNNFGNYDQNVWSVAMDISSIGLNMPYDNWKVRKPVKLDKESLAGIAGVYKLTDPGTFQIRWRKQAIELEGDRIFAKVPGLPPLELYAESDSVLYLANFNDEYRFIKEGKQMKLTVREHGQEFHLEKVE